MKKRSFLSKLRFFMYSYYLKYQQQDNTGDAENAGDEGVEPVEGNVEIHPCAEEIEDKQEHEAEDGVDKELEGQLHGSFEYFQQQAEK